MESDEEEAASQADDGCTQNVGDWGQCWDNQRTSDVDGYESADGNDADADVHQAVKLLQVDDVSTQNVADWPYSTSDGDD